MIWISKATGRPGYHPGDLLKLHICSYLNRVRSSRRLEAGAHCNIEVIWLLRRLTPATMTSESCLAAAYGIAESNPETDPQDHNALNK